MLMGLDHLTINLKNKEESLAFYGDFLGLPFLKSVDMGDQEIIYFQLTETAQLELIHNFTEEPCAIIAQKNRRAYRHMALETDNLEEFRDRCVEYAIPLVMDVTDMVKLGCKGILIQDLNGVELEFIEKLQPPD